ncbi:MAG TPA: MdtA/MuxA family multidrug efflux RND transporter periplasmic adaptor subunit [Terriglobia bacterium]|nr:MdtA/MuxA family multidrug efflux RND transporter periplasmic adaptor subunit [Terriglobia bacterium]
MEKPEVLAPISESETSRPRKPHHRWIPWLLVIVFAVVAVLGWRAANRRQQEEQALRAEQARAAALRPVPVAVAKVSRRNFPVYLTGLGSVTAYNTVTIQPRVSGQILKLSFREGQHVKAGQMLVQIDPRQYEVQLQQAQGQLSRDQAQLHDAVLNETRGKALFGSGIIPRQQFDTQQALVGQLRGALAADKAQIANAQLNLSYCQLRAPISGKVGLRMVDVGNIVQPSTGILVITQMHPISAIFTLPEEQLAPILRGLRAGQSFRVEAYDRADQHEIARGTLLATDNLINQTTGTLRLKATFPNEDEALFPNEFVNIHIETQVLRNALILPAAALQRGTQGNFVFVVRPDHTVEERPVDVEMTQGNSVIFRSGVQPGETVVTDGQDKLRVGSHVTPQKPSHPALAAGEKGL